jgi:hypothetical protein
MKPFSTGGPLLLGAELTPKKRLAGVTIDDLRIVGNIFAPLRVSTVIPSYSASAVLMPLSILESNTQAIQPLIDILTDLNASEPQSEEV